MQEITGQFSGLVLHKRAVRIVIADDHAVVRDGLARLLGEEPDFEVVAAAQDGEETLRAVTDFSPDILLLDIAMPGVNGIEVLRALSVGQSPVRTILLTAAIEKAQIAQALEFGARGLIMKSEATGTMVKCIRRVVAGEVWFDRETMAELLSSRSPEAAGFGLTARELELISEIAAGSSNHDIARKLGIAEPTVKRHLANIFDKTGVSSRLELAVFAMNHGLVPKPDHKS